MYFRFPRAHAQSSVRAKRDRVTPRHSALGVGKPWKSRSLTILSFRHSSSRFADRSDAPFGSVWSLCVLPSSCCAGRVDMTHGLLEIPLNARQKGSTMLRRVPRGFLSRAPLDASYKLNAAKPEKPNGRSTFGHDA